MELFQLKLFISVAHTLNFTRTANDFFITQPAVSYQIKDLEKELGVRLFTRDTHSLKITQAGFELLDYAMQICELEDHAVQRMKNISEERNEKLTIALLHDYIPVFSEILTPFSKKHPKLQIDIYVLDGPELIKSIRNAEYDFYFAIDAMIMENPDYGVYLMSKSPMELFAYKELADKINLDDWKTMENIPFISISQSYTQLCERVNDILEVHGLKPVVKNFYNRPDFILLSINSGIGISILPANYKNPAIYPNIVTFPLNDWDVYPTSAIGYRKNSGNEMAFQFKSLLQQHIKLLLHQ